MRHWARHASAWPRLFRLHRATLTNRWAVQSRAFGDGFGSWCHWRASSLWRRYQTSRRRCSNSAKSLQRSKPPIVEMYVPRKASPLGRLGPFVKPICRDQASPFTAGRAKRGFLSYGFAARIDQQWPVVWLRLLLPMRNEPPPHRPQSAPLIRRHNRNRIGWTDVIVLLGGQVV